MESHNNEHITHQVFSELDCYIDFYEQFAMSVFRFCSPGVNAIFGFDSYIYSSMQGTLESLKGTLKAGRIADAYALLRRFYDSAIINIYLNLFLQDHFDIENRIVEQINDWLQGKSEIPEYRVMSQHIRDSSKLKAINALLYVDDRYRGIRHRCNSFMHYNFFQHVLLNDGQVFVKDRHKWVDAFSVDARDIFILHLAYVFFLNDHHMMSSDYIDCLECDMVPEPDSQYWVAPFIQEVFSEVLVATRPDVADAIKLKTSMHLS